MRPGCKIFGSVPSTPASVDVGRGGSPDRPAGKINRYVPSEGQEDEEEQGVDLQSIEDSFQSALAFLGNAATHAVSWHIEGRRSWKNTIRTLCSFLKK